MTDAAIPDTAERPKGGKLPLIIGLVLALLGGGGGFYATSQGLILASESPKEETTEMEPLSGFKDIAFVPLDPLTVSMPPSSKYKHLRFRAELEVEKKYASDVETVVPRIVDVLNSYLRAVDVRDIEDAASLTRLRAQMLRRVQIVAGPGRINDLLIMEFVLN
ncbi:flagellar basal body-associated FliL family protein [Roseobacter weihaiensis]|uniref:flagellar basal body-associated FliL family protein n=1 Tax=Roseobacter weihaiensis TaxID=2763262 RepID=UPI001D0B348E|nr:flagellar basal body-associated FliL family protein [Roseobacter sp. H9]